MDDLLVWGENEEQHDNKVLERARVRNLKLNKEKCHIKQQEISYVGHILTKDGIKPYPGFLSGGGGSIRPPWLWLSPSWEFCFDSESI